MDTLSIKQLQLPTIIGVHHWERQCPQTLWVDINLAVDIRPAGASDNLTDALDYSALADDLIHWAGQQQFQLIEAFAEALAQRILSRYRVPWLRLAVFKPGAVLACQTLGVEIERGQKPL